METDDSSHIIAIIISNHYQPFTYYLPISCIMLPYGYGSIPINTIFSGMNIHKSQLFWCELQGYQGFDTLPYIYLSCFIICRSCPSILFVSRGHGHLGRALWGDLLGRAPGGRDAAGACVSERYVMGWRWWVSMFLPCSMGIYGCILDSRFFLGGMYRKDRVCWYFSCWMMVWLLLRMVRAFNMACEWGEEVWASNLITNPEMEVSKNGGFPKTMGFNTKMV